MARFNGPRWAYTLTYWGGTTVRVAGPDGVDMVSNVETFAFDDQRVAFSVPPAITSNGGGDTATVSVLENTTAVTTVTAFDPDSTTKSFAIVGGADQARFSIVSLAFSSARIRRLIASPVQRLKIARRDTQPAPR